MGSSVGNEDMLSEVVDSKVNSQFDLIGLETAINIREIKLLVVVDAGRTRILVSWAPFRSCSFDEDIAGSCVDIKVVAISFDDEGKGKEIPH